MVVSLPMALITSGKAVGGEVFGTGDWKSFGGTVLWELRLHGPALVFSSRVMPILVSITFAWWLLRRFGARLLEPVPLLSILAFSLSLRLIFEQGLFGYKFMPLAVMLIALDITQGRIRGQLVAWLALVTLAFNPIPDSLDFNAKPWGDHAAAALPAIGIAVVVLFLAWAAVHRRRPRLYVVGMFVITVCAFLQWPPWAIGTLREPLPKWFWQTILLSTGVVLALGPLVTSLRHRESDPLSIMEMSPLDSARTTVSRAP